MDTLHFQLETMHTPIGVMHIVTDAQARLRAIDWQDYEGRIQLLMRRQYKAYPAGAITLTETSTPSHIQRVMQDYFDGDIHAINELPVATGGTEFQNDTWAALRQIPPGHPISYRELAERIGRPTATRAVGLANGSNPVGIVVPCHRVIGSNASLTGYGGGLHRKQWLLEHEHRHAGLEQQTAWQF